MIKSKIPKIIFFSSRKRELRPQVGFANKLRHSLGTIEAELNRKKLFRDAFGPTMSIDETIDDDNTKTLGVNKSGVNRRRSS
jgi:hypothetical protein